MTAARKTAAANAAFDADQLTALAGEIEKRQDVEFDDLRHRLETDEGLKIGETAKGSGLWTASFGGVEGGDGPSPQLALANWANAARRKALELGAEPDASIKTEIPEE